MDHLSGLVAATYTPMNQDLSLNLEMIDAVAERLIGDRVTGIFVCGATGEFPSLSMEERIQVAERWQAAGGDQLKLIVHVGGTCLADAKQLVAHAEQIGAYGISAIAPFFYKPATLEVLIDFCAEISKAAPHLPFYYYHLPVLSGVDFPMVRYLELGPKKIPGLAGIKYSNLDLMDMGLCVDFDDGRFNILFGVDEMLLSGLAAGAPGAVGSSYSFAAPLYNRVIDAFNAGDNEAARKLQLSSMKMVAIVRRYGGHRAMKQIMKMVGLDCGPIRLPQHPLANAEYETLVAELDAVGFFDFCSRGEKTAAVGG